MTDKKADPQGQSDPIDPKVHGGVDKFDKDKAAKESLAEGFGTTPEKLDEAVEAQDPQHVVNPQKPDDN